MREELLLLITQRKKKSQQTKRYTAALLVFVLLAHIALVYLPANTFFGPYRSLVSRYIPFPAVVVGNKIIYTPQLEKNLRYEYAVQENVYRIDLSYSSEAGQENRHRLRGYVIDEMVNEILMRRFADRVGIYVEADEVSNELDVVAGELGVRGGDFVGVVRFLSGAGDQPLRERIYRTLLKRKIEENALMMVAARVLYVEKSSDTVRNGRIQELISDWNDGLVDYAGATNLFSDILTSTVSSEEDELVMINELPFALRSFAISAPVGDEVLLEDEQGYYVAQLVTRKSGYPGSLSDLLENQRETASIRVLVP